MDKTQTLFVNRAYDNQASLNATIDGSLTDFGSLTWRELIEDVLYETIGDEEFLEENFGIGSQDIERELTADEIDRYYTEIAYDFDNISGPAAQAFNLIRGLEGFPCDKDGNGDHEGISQIQTTANGPRKITYIKDEKAARWLEDQLKKEGHLVSICFV